MMKKRLLTLLALFALPGFAADGEKLFLKDCAACHQADGRGVGRDIPPLAGSPILLSDETEVAGVVLRGKAGMPAFALFAKDAELAAILTYARGAWGNAAPEVSERTLADVRKTLGDQIPRPPGN